MNKNIYVITYPFFLFLCSHIEALNPVWRRREQEEWQDCCSYPVVSATVSVGSNIKPLPSLYPRRPPIEPILLHMDIRWGQKVQHIQDIRAM